MATITDDDLKMFQERSKTEFASRCDTGGIAWDSVIWDLCNEVRKLRGALAKCADWGEQIDHQLGSSDATVYAFRNERCLAHNISECARAALAATGKKGGDDA